jgi:hypothetical protein
MGTLRQKLRYLRYKLQAPLTRTITSAQATPGPNQRDIWSIAIYTGTSPLDINPISEDNKPALTSQDVKDVRADFVADPFMIQKGGEWYMFFEVLNHDTQRGQIAFATSKDGLQWTYRNIILDEPFHLSYPYVFEWEDEHYMIPETHQARAVRLYKARNFPYQWEFVRNLIKDIELADASPVYYDHHWWLFAGAGQNWHSSELRLYHSKDLQGPWIEHPKSPIIHENSHISRPAGRILNQGGKIYRLAQNCKPLYGQSVTAFEILKMTKTHYQENVILRKPIVQASGNAWNSNGMHHMDAHQIEKNLWRACVDGWTWGNTTHQ